jgi:FkbM family methyltransferase
MNAHVSTIVHAAGERRRRLRGELRGLGASVRIGAGRLNVRLLPGGATRTPLRVDLGLVGPILGADVGFVQVGANDGMANDPIYDLVRQHGWRGVLIEPQPAAFARLTETYADIEGLVLINAAVSATAGEAVMWVIAGDAPGDPWWRDQVASFSHKHLLRHVQHDPALLARVAPLSVRTITIEDAFAAAPRPVRVLQIDAEGFDAQVVGMVDWARHRPDVVRFEHRHLSLRDHSRATELLATAGYHVAVGEDDTIAMLHEAGRGRTATD